MITDQNHMRHRYESAVAGAPSWRASFAHRTAVALSHNSDAFRALAEGYLDAGTAGFTTGTTKRHNPCAAHSHRARPT